MFPRGLLIFILILVFDIISKSIRDKKKVEQSRRKRQEKLNRDIIMEKRKDSIPSMKSKESIPSESNFNEYTVEAKGVEIGSFNDQAKRDNKYMASKDSTKKEDKTNFNEKKNKIRNDVLKGIIYSEILSEPKSLKNMKRSM